MPLGDLGGFFSGDKTAMRFAGDVDDVQQRLLAGGEANAAQQALEFQARTAAQQALGGSSGSPALAARGAAQAGATAASRGVFQAAQMRQNAMTQGAGMAQERILAERARLGNAVGALAGVAGQVGAMAIPGGQAAGAAGLLGSITGGETTDTSQSPAFAGPPAPQGLGQALGNPAGPPAAAPPQGLGQALGSPSGGGLGAQLGAPGPSGFPQSQDELFFDPTRPQLPPTPQPAHAPSPAAAPAQAASSPLAPQGGNPLGAGLAPPPTQGALDERSRLDRMRLLEQLGRLRSQ